MYIAEVAPADIDALLDIQDECGLSPWTRAGYADEINRPEAVMLVARPDSESIAGFIVGRVPIVASAADAAEGEILNIGSRPKYREQGVGSMLMDRFLEISSERGCERVWLEVRESNHEALKFYARYRFVVAARRPDFYSDPVEDALLMIRESGP